MIGEEGFRMELNPLSRGRCTMPDPHRCSVIGHGGDLKIRRHTGHHQGMVSSHREGTGHPAKDTLSPMMNHRDLAVDGLDCSRYAPSECHRHALHAQTDAEDGDASFEPSDCLHRKRGILGSPGARRDDGSYQAKTIRSTRCRFHRLVEQRKTHRHLPEGGRH
ncbi:MAG: hypothetical protein MZU79_02440 [Anaerotruncus sp.]|nr:hypothetical protein [Anaerotruncus sp.]